MQGTVRYGLYLELLHVVDAAAVRLLVLAEVAQHEEDVLDTLVHERHVWQQLAISD